MKRLSIISIMLILFGCHQAPNYNPFDNQFNVSIHDFISNGCDTIPAGCGYFNLQQTTGDFRIFYQVYNDDFEKVLAKGFTFYIDTFRLNSENQRNNEKLLDSLYNCEIDINSLELILKKFDYNIIDRERRLLKFANKVTKDTIAVGLGFSFNEDELLFIKEYNYYKSKNDTPTKNKNH